MLRAVTCFVVTYAELYVLRINAIEDVYAQEPLTYLINKPYELLLKEASYLLLTAIITGVAVFMTSVVSVFLGSYFGITKKGKFFLTIIFSNALLVGWMIWIAIYVFGPT